ncbi:PREDICTED: uncharacterized protein LOC106303247 [Brassica oleracea var. oleracea]|uniref:uncharacterized protein LOC106303247 n=1 Tax=Brassica oleracea var. oleracea TaxID=109376 RepID=UPI0006A6E060|nr:PREDICTED: uncharacterized protein LOC106303247 [Brassica oleracea var. oleracea]
MGTAAFSWRMSRHYDLLLLHNSDDHHSCVRPAASWDEDSLRPKVFAERCKRRSFGLYHFYLIVADIQCKSMYYIKHTQIFSVEYHEVTPGAYILSECGLNGMGRNDPTNAKSETLMIQFEKMLASNQEYDYQIAKTIMTNPTRADEDDVLSSVFVDTVGYGTVRTSSIIVEDFIDKLNMFGLRFFERGGLF